MAFRYLSEPELDAVHGAAVDLGLATDTNMRALMAGIRPAFVAMADIGGVPSARLLYLLETMNGTRALVGGEVPLEKWLANASRLARGMEEEKVFRHALATVAADGVTDPSATDDVKQAPRGPGGELEVQIGDQDDTLGVDFLLQGAVAARSVALLRVHRHFDGQPSFLAGSKPDVSRGTGWLIGPGLVITNHHVIGARADTEPAATDADFALQAAATEADFDVFDAVSTPVTVPVAALEATDPVLDYAVLRLAAGPDGRAPLRLRTNPLTRPAASALRERVNVLQHPNGDPMRLGFRNNFVVTGSAERLSYLTDTDGGSSGSPICDDEWEVAGLHRGWAPLEVPVDVWGQSIGQENYGTPIGRILADLQARRPALHDEIIAAQTG
jgi:endonuclease G, mitochondrial